MTMTATVATPWWSQAAGRIWDRLMTSDLHVPAPAPADPLGSLLKAVAAGDRGAYGEVYDAVAGLVYGIVLRVVRDPAQSEEVAQEVMLEVWRRAEQFDPDRGSVRGWVATMAHRRAVDLVRSVQASRNRSEAYGVEAAGAPAFDTVAEEVADRHEHDAVRRALDELTPTQRESIELAYYEGLTYREVAERLGAPLGTVKTRMRDGLLRLRTVLGVDDG